MLMAGVILGVLIILGAVRQITYTHQNKAETSVETTIETTTEETASETENE